MLSLDSGRSSDPFIRFPPYGKRGLTWREASDIVRQFDRVTIAALLQYFQPGRLMHGFLVESKPEQAPNPDSRVSLDHARDAFGQNRVKLDWRTLPIDRRTVVRAEEILDGELRRLGVGRLGPLGPGESDGWPENLEGGWHQIGTTRAAADPKEGVVDGELKVHGLENLFIAGSSVFPTGGAAPPTLTIVALAVRLAERLQHEFAASRRHPARNAGHGSSRRRPGRACARLVARVRAPELRGVASPDLARQNPNSCRMSCPSPSRHACPRSSPEVLASAIFLFGEYLSELAAENPRGDEDEDEEDAGQEIDTAAVLDLFAENLGTNVTTTLTLYMRVTALYRLLAASPSLARHAIEDPENGGALTEDALLAAARLDLRVTRQGEEGTADFDPRQFREALSEP